MELVEIINHCYKIKTIDDILLYYDEVIDLAKDDVKKIAEAKRLFFYDFDYVYKVAAGILKKQLSKTHLRAIKALYTCDNLDQVLAWLVSRLLNNSRNISHNARYSEYVNIQEYFHETIAHIDSNIELEIMIDEIEKLCPKSIKEGLNKLYFDVVFDKDFDLEDFEKLCNKYNFESKDVLGFHPRERPNMAVELTESGNSQLVLLFDNHQ